MEACDINMSIYSKPDRNQCAYFAKLKQQPLWKPLETVSACSEIPHCKCSACQSALSTNTSLSLTFAVIWGKYLLSFTHTHSKNIFSGTQATISSEDLWVCQIGVWASCGSLSQCHRWEEVSTGAINITGATSNKGWDRARDLPNH